MRSRVNVVAHKSDRLIITIIIINIRTQIIIILLINHITLIVIVITKVKK